jgi:hypothetical protein
MKQLARKQTQNWRAYSNSEAAFIPIWSFNENKMNFYIYTILILVIQYIAYG